MCTAVAGAFLLLCALGCDEDECPGGSRPALGTQPRVGVERGELGAQRDKLDGNRDCVGVDRTPLGVERSKVGVERPDIERATDATRGGGSGSSGRKPVVDPEDPDAPASEDGVALRGGIDGVFGSDDLEQPRSPDEVPDSFDGLEVPDLDQELPDLGDMEELPEIDELGPPEFGDELETSEPEEQPEP